MSRKIRFGGFSHPTLCISMGQRRLAAKAGAASLSCNLESQLGSCQCSVDQSPSGLANVAAWLQWGAALKRACCHLAAVQQLSCRLRFRLQFLHWAEAPQRSMANVSSPVQLPRLPLHVRNGEHRGTLVHVLRRERCSYQ